MIIGDYLRLRWIKEGQRVRFPDGKEGIVSHHFEYPGEGMKTAVFFDDPEWPTSFCDTHVQRVETCFEHIVRIANESPMYAETDENFRTLAVYKTDYTEEKLEALKRWSYRAYEIANEKNGFDWDTSLGYIPCDCEHDCCGCICERQLEFFIVPGSGNVWFSIVETRNY